MFRRAQQLYGAVEGFYGKPWSQPERFQLFDWMRRWGLNAYLYAPKDDLKHRALWREPYSAEERNALAELIRECSRLDVRFIYALAPGLDIRYSSPADLENIQRRFDGLLRLGCRDFALLFDDIPPEMSAADAAVFGSFASAHAQVTNCVFNWTRERSPEAAFLFCPTPYCGRMAQRQLGGANYLATIGGELMPEIQVLWTGPEIVSRTITESDLPLELLRRKPILWDNLHANDYDRSRFFCGPYAGRDLRIRERISGILSNPNNEFPLNFVPLRTLAMFRNGDENWNPRGACLQALQEWHAHFKTVGQPITLAHLTAFADCHYLPHEDGPEAEALFNAARERKAEYSARSALVREFCQRAAELCDRELFYALSQRVWDLREELDLVDRWLQSGGGGFTSDFHLSGTYRGGFVRRLQRLLARNAEGAFVPASFEP